MYNILIVEDEYLSRYVMSLIIYEEFKNNVNIIQAEDGIKAKGIIDREKIDLGIIDMNIPGIKGIEICKYLRKKYNDIPIIITTGDYDGIQSEKILRLNINEYLVKPIELPHIIKLLKKYIKLEIKENKDIVISENNYLKNISHNIVKGNKKDTIKITKEYIDYLYNYDDENYHKVEITNLTDQIKYISKKVNMPIYEVVERRINNLKLNPLIYKDKNTVINEFVKVYNDMFDNHYEEIDYSFNTYIKDAISYVERNVKKNITLEEVAKYINITPHYLSKIFKKYVGVNFVTFITDKKIELAKEMLIDEDIPIVNISIELSYNQPNYFSKVFKRKVGITPSEYREKHLLHNQHIKIK